ncbi:unnamed protein product [Effrenium voratum]|nr:unnamed protein product [Effrenium voratum]
MGVVLNTIPNQADGTLDLDEVAKYIKPENEHFARAKVLALENTQNKLGGAVKLDSSWQLLPLEYMEKAGDFCQQHNLKLHVDGARLWNAAVALKVPLKEVVRRADSVSICFSKGLGAPVGSVLCGPTDFIAKARRLRKAVGGAEANEFFPTGLLGYVLHARVGVLAAAQLYALDHNLERLHEDHENASRLAAGLKALGLHVLPAPTNIVFFDVDEAPQVVASLGQRGVRILCTDGRRRCRAVTHLHIRSKDIDYFLTQISEILSK